MGDFNAKIGQRKHDETTVLGPWGYGSRNKRGKMLIEFCLENELYIMNSHFKKKIKNKWTWRSPDGKTLNEIDFFITSKFNIKNIQNIEIITTTHPTDHRMVRATLSLGTKAKRNRKGFKNKQNELTEAEIQTLQTNFIKLSSKLQGKLNLQEQYDQIIDTIKTSTNTIPTVKKKKQIEYIITDKIAAMIEERKEINEKTIKTVEDKTNIRQLYKKIRKNLKRNKARYKQKIVEEELEKRRSVKRGNRRLNTNKDWIQTLYNNKESKITNRKNILKTATDFYKNLYRQKEDETSIHNRFSIQCNNDDRIPQILTEEVNQAIKRLATMKSPGDDNITNDVLKALVEPLTPLLTGLFNQIIEEQIIPEQWETAIITLLYKKGDPLNISNYRPISLLQSTYKLFTTIIINRLKQMLDSEQPREQAGFRSKFSTIDHIFTLRQIIEKYSEYRKTLYIAYVDYSKAFDTIHHNQLWKAMSEQGIPYNYIKIMIEIYNRSKAAVRLEDKGEVFQLERGVRQGDPISPNLFNCLLEYIFKQLKWSDIGININGETLNHLRFADDIALICERHSDLKYMLVTLDEKSRECGLEMNPEKTSIMTNGSQETIIVNGKIIGYVDQYVYLGQNISLQNHYIEEIERRIKKAWNTYWSLKHIFKSKMKTDLKRKAMDSVITPTLIYGCQTWPITKEVIHKLQIFQRSAERSMLGIKLKDKVRNSDIREKTKIIDAAKTVCSLKWRWAGHTARTLDNRWSERMLHWYPREDRRPAGRPRRRWADDIVETAGNTWTRQAQDRTTWKQMEEAFVQKWTTNKL